MKIAASIIALLCSQVSGVVTLTNDATTTDNRIVLNGSVPATETVTIVQNFTIGDAQVAGVLYDFEFITFNVDTKTHSWVAPSTQPCLDWDCYPESTKTSRS